MGTIPNSASDPDLTMLFFGLLSFRYSYSYYVANDLFELVWFFILEKIRDKKFSFMEK